MNNKYDILTETDLDFINDLDLAFKLKNVKKPDANNNISCLKCTLEFKSTGKHNRLCNECRKELGYE